MMPRALAASGGFPISTSKSLSQISKGTPGEIAGRQVMGNARMGHMRRINEGVTVGRTSTKSAGTTFVSATNVVPMTEDVAAKRFAAVVHRIDAGTLASAAKRTKEAAKMWKAGRRCPNGSSLINMSSSLPVVWEWLQSEVEVRRASSTGAILAQLHHTAAMGGPEAAEARAILAAISKSIAT